MSTLVNKDTTVDNRNFWMNKMGSALKEIQELYDSKLEEVRAQCETSYATKVGVAGCSGLGFPVRFWWKIVMLWKVILPQMVSNKSLMSHTSHICLWSHLFEGLVIELNLNY